MSDYLGTGDGLMPATHQLPDVVEDVDALYWFDSATRWHLGEARSVYVKAVCGTKFDHPAFQIERDGNPTVHADLPLCKRCAAIDSKEARE